MNGKSYALHFGMLFQKFYCAKCGEKLEKERTHRVVTKGDKDYYQYQSRTKFPQRDWDVYDDRFRCPGCEAGISYEEQCVLRSIQKKHGKRVLTAAQIREDYKAAKKARDKKVLLTAILIATGGLMLSFVLSGVSQTEGDWKDLASFGVFAGVTSALVALGVVARHNGKSRLKAGYAYETETLLQKLHTYSTHNKALVEQAEKCYCFRCRKVWEKRRIKSFADDGQTALCPGCGTAAILPDSIEEPLDEKTLALMQDYWF